MDILAAPTVVAAFDAVTATDATRPLLTYYDDATGERTELSAATLGNWVAKTANLLVDGAGLGAGDVAAVALPAHWLTAAVLLGCWSAGLVVDPDPDAGGRAAVAFACADRLARVGADDVYALALAPLGMGFRSGPPEGTLDFTAEVRGFSDHFRPAGAVAPSAAALTDGRTHADLIAAARAVQVPAGARLLVDGDERPDPIAWLLAPLVAGGSVVLCRNLDPARLAARLVAERAIPA